MKIYDETISFCSHGLIELLVCVTLLRRRLLNLYGCNVAAAEFKFNGCTDNLLPAGVLLILISPDVIVA